MSNYEIIGVRFNMNTDEAIIYNNLNPKNKAGHIKKILKQVFIGDGIQIARRSYIEEIVKSIISDKYQINDIKNELKNNDIQNIDEDKILSAVKFIMKG